MELWFSQQMKEKIWTLPEEACGSLLYFLSWMVRFKKTANQPKKPQTNKQNNKNHNKQKTKQKQGKTTKKTPNPNKLVFTVNRLAFITANYFVSCFGAL